MFDRQCSVYLYHWFKIQELNCFLGEILSPEMCIAKGQSDCQSLWCIHLRDKQETNNSSKDRVTIPKSCDLSRFRKLFNKPFDPSMNFRPNRRTHLKYSKIQLLCTCNTNERLLLKPTRTKTHRINGSTDPSAGRLDTSSASSSHQSVETTCGRPRRFSVKWLASSKDPSTSSETSCKYPLSLAS